ncbi:hypothetical protein [Streptomyces rimosus]|uniref:hypothetical protein n=1 Tax=Streptomyces rimosus TaxID=1927 RepID=UPI0004BFFF3C|nr:hypothetical protein [Streptomyces rimosus]
MNLRDSIEIGVTRTPAAAVPAPRTALAAVTEPASGTVVTLADGGITSARLAPTSFAVPDDIRQATAHWSLEQVTAAASAFRAEAIRRRESQFVDVLRALFFVPPAEAPPVARVEFVTDGPFANGVFWDESRVYLHHEDGSVAPFEDSPDADEDDEYAALDEVFREMLTDIAADNPPQHGDRLVVDLATGEFERSGKWAQ